MSIAIILDAARARTALTGSWAACMYAAQSPSSELPPCDRSGIRRQTLAEFEGDVRRPQARVRDAILGVLDDEGVRFVEIAGTLGVVLALSSKQS